MLHRRFFIFILALLSTTAFADQFTVEADLSFLTGLGDRREGSPAESLALELISGRLEGLGVGFTIQDLSSAPTGHSFSKNLVASIPGSGGRPLVVAAPLDNGAYGCALLLELADLWSNAPPEGDVILTFLGGERGDSSHHPYGSRDFLARNTDADIAGVLYLDAEHPPRTWRLGVGGDGVVAPWWLVSETLEALERSSVPYRLRGTDIQVARLGLHGDLGPLSPWLNTEIPVLRLQGAGTGTAVATATDSLRLTDALIDLARSIGGHQGGSQRTYLYIRPILNTMGGIVPELPYVTGFLAVTALVLLTGLLQARNVRLNIKRTRRYWWTWPLMFIVTFLFLFLSTLILEEVGLLADFPTLWTHTPGTFVFFKLSVSGALSLIFLLIMRGLPLPRTPHYYAYAAVGTSVMTVLWVAAYDVTLAAYPLWGLVQLIAFTAVRRPEVKPFFLVLLVIPYLAGLAVVVGQPYEEILSILLFSRIEGNLNITLLLLPVVLALSSLNYWRHHYQRSRRNIVTPAATLALSFSVVITFIWLLQFDPYSQANPQPVELVDRIDLSSGTRRVIMTSPAPIGDVVLTLDGRDYTLRGIDREAEVRAPLNRSSLEARYSSRTFLGRRTVTVLLTGENNPVTLTLRLTGDQSYTLHECNMPFQMDSRGNAARIFVGDNPPFPFELRFTVNSGANLNLEVDGEWLNPEAPPAIMREDLAAQSRRMARLSIPLSFDE